MKNSGVLFGFALLSLLFLQFSFSENTFETGIKVYVADPEFEGEGLIGATIKVFNLKHELFGGAVTDFEGIALIELNEGQYHVEISYTGRETKKINDVLVKKSELTEINVTLEPSTSLDQVEIIAYKVPLVSSASKSKKSRISSTPPPTREARPSTTISPATGLPPSETKPAAKEDIKIRGSRDEATDYYVDGVRVEAAADDAAAYEIVYEPDTYEEKIVLKDAAAEAAPEAEVLTISEEHVEGGGTIPQPKPKAGLLTAGEWNDLNNWNSLWTQQWADGEIAEHSDRYGFRPEHRYTVLLSNENDVPLVDVPVFLKNKKGETLWTARTDNMGKAELWHGLFEKAEKSENLRVFAEIKGKTKEIAAATEHQSGIMRHQINADCDAPKQVDIVWTVDATGSMGDELEYLKTELLDVINRVKGINPDLTVRLGSVFYRDKTDEYLVKASKLSPNVEETVKYIGEQRAHGGGDYPEAVDAALDEAIFNQPWSDNAVARICFLVLDASPHDTPEAKQRIQAAAQRAAARGIRIVPISGSGIRKDTEYLMKFLGLATNGTYVFLTDDSGIGGTHLAPTTDEYKVEPLNDLLVRLITEYSTVEDCDGQSIIRFEQDPSQQQTTDVWSIRYFPNPATDFITFELPTNVESITLYDAEGKAVRKIESPQAGTETLHVHDLPSGVYTLRVWKDGRYKTGKVMVLRKF